MAVSLLRAGVESQRPGYFVSWRRYRQTRKTPVCDCALQRTGVSVYQSVAYMWHELGSQGVMRHRSSELGLS
jgi:hypothetical protein